MIHTHSYQFAKVIVLIDGTAVAEQVCLKCNKSRLISEVRLDGKCTVLKPATNWPKVVARILFRIRQTIVEGRRSSQDRI